VSAAVLEANSSVLTNKYAEGLPGKRYYGGCAVVDEVETLAIERLKKLFGASFANVQPHSGAQANQAAFEASIKPGDTILGMRLDQGGHLTHGSPVNFSGKHYKVVAYGVRRDDGLIDEEEVLKLARENKPKMIIAGASAYPRRIDFSFFKKVADEVGAVLLADIAHYAGLVAAGVYPTPVGFADIVTSTTHKTLRGPRSGIIMPTEKFASAVNKAVFPGLQGGPHMHTIAAKAVAFHEALQPSFKVYAEQVIKNARALGEVLKAAGLRLSSGGTDCHLLLVDVRPLKLTGAQAEAALGVCGITANKNMIPFDPEKPSVTSGIRLGTPAVTTRGMREADMQELGEMILAALKNHENAAFASSLKSRIESFTAKFPFYLE
jgi:glycine hydroxymethyltransferase